MALVSYSLLQLLNARGEDEVPDVLSSFRCERNKDIEDFVRYNAFDFNLRGFCASYLVFDTDAAALVGFYALALKIASIPENVVSKQLTRSWLLLVNLDQKLVVLICLVFCWRNLGKAIQV